MPTLSAIPIEEQVIQDVLSCANTVKRNAGYSIDLNAERLKPNTSVDPNLMAHGSAVVWAKDKTPKDGPVQNEDWEIPVTVCARVVGVDSSDYSIETILRTVAADIQRAVCGSYELRKRNRWAIWTFDGPTRTGLTNEQSTDGVVEVDFRVWFRHLLDDPLNSSLTR